MNKAEICRKKVIDEYKNFCNSLSEEDRIKFQKTISLFFDYLMVIDANQVRCCNKLYEVNVDVLETDE